MKYKLYNKTKISNKTLHKIINFCSPKGFDNFKVYIRYISDGEYGGMYYNKWNRISIGINRKLNFPQAVYHKELRKYGYISKEILKNTIELMAEVYSHEARHGWQYTVSKQNFKDNPSTHIFTYNNQIFQTNIREEKDACRYASKMLLKWRKFIKDGN